MFYGLLNFVALPRTEVRLCSPLKLQAAKAPVKLIKNVGSDGGSNGSSDVIVTRVEVCFPTAVQETMSAAAAAGGERKEERRAGAAGQAER